MRLDDARTEMTRTESYGLGLEDLLAIAANGWALHPLIPGTKKPATKHGLKDATTDPEQIEAWWRERHDLGWGTPTATVADIDRPDQMELELPSDAPIQRTPSGGRHVFMLEASRRLPGKLPGNAGEWRAAETAYVKIYDPSVFLRFRPEELPEVPEEAFTVDTRVSDGEPLELTTREELISLVGRLRDSGLDPDDIREILERMKDDGRIYDSRADDPWTSDDFMQLAGEAGKWKRGEIVAAPRVKHAGEPDPDEPYSIPLAEVDETEPQPLLLGVLDPAEHSILFGTGGTGKGVVAAWWAVQLVMEHDFKVLVVDYEGHARFEWRPRVRQFAVNYKGLGKDESDRVLRDIRIVQPRAPIWKEAARIAQDCEDNDLDFVIIDSITYAVGDQEAEKSITATKYSLALTDIPVPALSLAHTTKADADPRYPFGSVYWHNGARITMSLVGENVEPRTLTQKKTNQRAMFKPEEIDWTWSAEGTAMPEDGLSSKPKEGSWAKAFRTLMTDAGRLDEWVTTREAYDLVVDAGHSPTSEASFRASLDAARKDPSFGVMKRRVGGSAEWSVNAGSQPKTPRVKRRNEG